MLCAPFWTLCLTSRGYPHEVEGELGGGKLFRPQSVFCVSPASIYFSVINLFLFTHCTVGAYQPARSSRTLPHRHVRVGHCSFNNKRLSICDDHLFFLISPSGSSFSPPLISPPPLQSPGATRGTRLPRVVPLRLIRETQDQQATTSIKYTQAHDSTLYPPSAGKCSTVAHMPGIAAKLAQDPPVSLSFCLL
jgi:hypothetical protein